MSIRGESLVLCERILHDSQTQNISAIACLDTVSSLKFPAQHTPFAISAKLRWRGSPPKADQHVEYRIMRYSHTDDEAEIARLSGEWAAGRPTARVWVSFQFLRLFRAEEIWFRLDHKLADGAWTQGPTSSLQISQLQLTEEQRAELNKAIRDAESTP